MTDLFDEFKTICSRLNGAGITPMALSHGFEAEQDYAVWLIGR